MKSIYEIAREFCTSQKWQPCPSSRAEMPSLESHRKMLRSKGKSLKRKLLTRGSFFATGLPQACEEQRVLQVSIGSIQTRSGSKYLVFPTATLTLKQQPLPDQVQAQTRGQDRLLCPQAPDHPGQEQVQRAQVPPSRPLHQPRHHLPDRHL